MTEKPAVLIFVFRLRHTSETYDQSVKTALLRKLIDRIIDQSVVMLAVDVVLISVVLSGDDSQFQVLSLPDAADHVLNELFSKIRPDVFQDQTNLLFVISTDHAMP